jgi:NTE family protein
MKRALVLAGGGVAGIAWELGVLRGIRDADPDLESSLVAADVIEGTSAGSAVAGQITSGTPLEDLYAAQLAPGTNPLSPATRGPSARAGREFGRAQAAELGRFWR